MAGDFFDCYPGRDHESTDVCDQAARPHHPHGSAAAPVWAVAGNVTGEDWRAERSANGGTAVCIGCRASWAGGRNIGQEAFRSSNQKVDQGLATGLLPGLTQCACSGSLTHVSDTRLKRCSLICQKFLRRWFRNVTERGCSDGEGRQVGGDSFWNVCHIRGRLGANSGDSSREIPVRSRKPRAEGGRPSSSEME